MLKILKNDRNAELHMWGDRHGLGVWEWCTNKIKLSRCAFFDEKFISFVNNTHGPRVASNKKKWHKIKCYQNSILGGLFDVMQKCWAPIFSRSSSGGATTLGIMTSSIMTLSI